MDTPKVTEELNRVNAEAAYYEAMIAATSASLTADDHARQLLADLENGATITDRATLKRLLSVLIWGTK